MKYIIMCGGTYTQWSVPRQLIEIRGEPIVARTIRLLKENGIEDIAISSNDARFEHFGVPVLHHENGYNATGFHNFTGYWADGFYPTNEPVCYLFGDVVFSPEAIRTIIHTDTRDVMFFASAPPFSPDYHKRYAEPFAFKVANQEHFRRSIEEVKRYYTEGRFGRKPISWELWNVIKGGDLNRIDYGSYVSINDYTCDIDYPDEAQIFNSIAVD